MGQEVDDPSEALDVFEKINSVLGIVDVKTGSSESSDDTDTSEAICKQIDEARASRDSLPIACVRSLSARAMRFALRRRVRLL